LSEYRFISELRPNLIFRCAPNGIDCCVATQRDSAYCGLATEIAVTFINVMRYELDPPGRKRPP